MCYLLGGNLKVKELSRIIHYYITASTKSGAIIISMGHTVPAKSRGRSNHSKSSRDMHNYVSKECRIKNIIINVNGNDCVATSL